MRDSIQSTFDRGRATVRLLQRLLTRLLHPKAVGKLDQDVVKAFGYATATASACGDHEVRPLHVLYGLMKTSPQDAGESTYEAKLEAIERLLGPQSDAPSTGVPAGTVVQEMIRSLVAEAVSSGRFFVTTADVHQVLKSLNDPQIDRLFS